MANRTGVCLIDGSTRYNFNLFKATDRDARAYSIKPRDWETGDPIGYWKEPLHPWDGGLASDRLNNKHVYSKANADLSNKGLLLPPPFINTTANNTKHFISTIANTSGNGAAVTEAVIDIETDLAVTPRPGDLIVGWLAVTDADAVTFTNTVGGMTALTAGASNNHKARAFYKVYTAALGGSYTFTFGATVDTYTYAFALFRGVSNTTPIHKSSVVADATSPYTTTAIVPTVNGCTILAMATRSGGSFTGTPAGFSVIETITPADGLSWVSKKQTTAASITAAFTGGTDTDGVLYAIALLPATYTWTLNNSRYVTFNDKIWSFDNTQLFSIDSNNICLQEYVFTTTITDICVFNQELIIGMGYSTKIWKATLATPEVFSQASDNTYAGKLTVVGSNLWRSTSTTGVSSCITTPLTLSNWGATYTVGESTYDITTLIDYGGALWVGKPNGFYTADVNTDFWNQTPQLASWPVGNDSNATNNTRGSFVAKGYLWCPSLSGLLRIAPGESIIVGPELSGRKDYAFWVSTGIEWGEAIYLLCWGRTGGYPCIIKMIEDVDNITDNPYIYHEWVSLTDFNNFAMDPAVGINIFYNTPCLFFNMYSTICYIDLAAGGGPPIDDGNYGYGDAWSFETGVIRPTGDLSLVTGLLGVEIVCDEDAGESIDTIQYKINEGSYTNMLTDQDSGSGTMPITNTGGYASVTRYAAKGAQGQFFGFKLIGSTTTPQYGTDRPEIREIYAFGYRRSKVTDIIALQIIADRNTIVSNGLRQGYTSGQILRLFRDWKRDQDVLTMELADYEESRTVHVRVVDIEYAEIDAQKSTQGIDKSVAVINIALIRDDLAGTYANA